MRFADGEAVISLSFWISSAPSKTELWELDSLKVREVYKNETCLSSVAL